MYCNDKNYLATENFKKLKSPLTNVKVIVRDSPLSKPENALGTNPIDITENKKESHGADLILTTKFIQEQFYTLFGIPITNSKNQSLSSDSSLSASQGDCIAREHDRRIEQFHKALGIEFNVEEIDLTPQNENADKEGMGFANTNGDEVQKKGAN